jgi:hypothetical protein
MLDTASARRNSAAFAPLGDSVEDPLDCSELTIGHAARQTTVAPVGAFELRQRVRPRMRWPVVRVRRQAGSMFWLRWKTLSGSYAALSALRRASLAGEYARATPVAPSSLIAFTYMPVAKGSSDAA